MSERLPNWSRQNSYPITTTASRLGTDPRRLKPSTDDIAAPTTSKKFPLTLCPRTMRGDTAGDSANAAHTAPCAARPAKLVVRSRTPVVGFDALSDPPSPCTASEVPMTQSPGPRYRQGPQQHGVGEAEDRGGHADADADRHDRCCGEPAIAVEHAQAVADVTNDIVEPDAGANVADAFLDLPDAAHLEQRGPPRLGGVPPSRIRRAVDISTKSLKSSSS